MSSTAWKMQTKAIARYTLTSVKTVLKKIPRTNARQDAEIRKFMYCPQEHKLVQPLQETVCWLLKKPNLELSSDPAIALMNLQLKEIISALQRDIIHPCLLLNLSKSLIWGQHRQPPIGKWLKRYGVYIKTKIYSQRDCYLILCIMWKSQYLIDIHDYQMLVSKCFKCLRRQKKLSAVIYHYTFHPCIKSSSCAQKYEQLK